MSSFGSTNMKWQVCNFQYWDKLLYIIKKWPSKYYHKKSQWWTFCSFPLQAGLRNSTEKNAADFLWKEWNSWSEWPKVYDSIFKHLVILSVYSHTGFITSSAPIFSIKPKYFRTELILKCAFINWTSFCFPTKKFKT